MKPETETHLKRRLSGRFLRKAPQAMAKLVSSSGLHRALRVPFGFSHSEVKTYGRIGPLEVRLTRSRSDIRKAQRLRYSVFYNEMSATPSIIARAHGRDKDPYDAICDHLLVHDTSLNEGHPTSSRSTAREQVVGTYRVLRQDMLRERQEFYSQGEYNITPLIASKSPRYRFMELGRSCVLKPYRNKRTVELLWKGLWSYAREHDIDVMIGCASFMGTDPREHAMALSFLHHEYLATPDWRVKAHDDLYVDMNMIPKDQINMKNALRSLPPLIKGYLRIGAYIGDGAVIDQQFGTTDVLIILPVERIDPRYFEYFGVPNERQSRVAAGLPVR